MTRAKKINLKISLASESGSMELIRPEAAIYPSLPHTYKCLDAKCQGDLIVVKRGKTKYFRHLPGEATNRCGFSSVHNKTPRRHDAAQSLLAVVLERAIKFHCSYPVLTVNHTGKTTFTTLCVNAAQVKTEWYSKEVKRRPDIALLDKTGDPVLYFEIYHTHAVDHNKRSDLSRSRWVEVDANQVLNDPFNLIVKHQGNVLPLLFDPNFQQLQLSGMSHAEW